MKKLLATSAPPAISGDLLVADFQNAVLNLVTMGAAQAEAEQSEADVTNALTYAAAGNGVFITAGDLTQDTQETLVKHSVDAHLKKVQAAQISSFTTVQINQLQAEDIKKYKNRKLRVTRLVDAADIIEPLWGDNDTGELRHGTYKGVSVTGIVDDLSFEQNTLVLRPTWLARTLVPGRKYWLIAVIDPDTVQPAVRIELL